jgi:hypothetical protein
MRVAGFREHLPGVGRAEKRVAWNTYGSCSVSELLASSFGFCD